MPHKKAKLEDEISFITKEEWEIRENGYKQRLQDIRISVDFIQEATQECIELEHEQLKKFHWDRYLSCDGLPRPHHSPEVRSFLSEVHHFLDEENQKTFDWKPLIDEYSILNQNLDRVDKTLKTLAAENFLPFDQAYKHRIDQILKVIDHIDMVLSNENEMSEMILSQALGIVQLRDEICREIEKIFDAWTYAIISKDWTYMISKDLKVAEYRHKSPNFIFQIWCLRDVPIRFHLLDLPLMIVNLDCLGVRVQMPVGVLSDGLTLQAIHMTLDSYSEGAKSYEANPNGIKEDIRSGISDIDESLRNEWEMQNEIMEQLKAVITEKKSSIANEAPKKQQASRKGGKEKIDSAELIEEKLPDPYEPFLRREHQEFLKFLEDNFNPLHFNLTVKEINLRQYMIIGGTYTLNFVRKLSHKSFKTFTNTIHEDSRILISRPDVIATLPKKNPRRINRYLDDDPTENAKPLPVYLEPEELPYFHITFTLPKYLCLWGMPVACQYIEEDEKIFDIELENPDSITTNTRPKLNRSQAVLSKSKSGLRTVHSQKGNMNYDFVSHHKGGDFDPVGLKLTPNIYRASCISSLRSLIVERPELPIIELNDFRLDTKLTQDNIVNLKRHMMPLILSSTKFPLEFREEILEQREKEMQHSNLLMRRPETNTLQIAQRPFDFNDQLPERLFPIFEDKEMLAPSALFVGHEADQIYENDKPDETFYQLYNRIKYIKSKYEEKHKVIAKQENFTVKVSKKPRAVKVPTDGGTVDLRKFPDKIKSNYILENVESEIKKLLESQSKVNTESGKSIVSEPAVQKGKSVKSDSVIQKGKSVSEKSESPTEKSVVYDTPSILLNQSEASRSSLTHENRSFTLRKVKHWTTAYISKTHFYKDHLKIRIQTDRLGIFGFAFKRYAHFPFRDWFVQLNSENTNEILFQLDTFHVRVILYISSEGITGYVTDCTKGFIAKPVKYLNITEPISNLNELKKVFCAANVNIFAEADASFYIDNGYFSEKHVATEMHVYDAIAIHSKNLKFYRSDWNRLAQRRDLILCMQNPKESIGVITVRVTPEASTFVEVSENCSDDIHIINLSYKNTWRNLAIYADLHQLINSIYPNITEQRNRDARMVYYLKKLLCLVRPLSFG